MRRSFGFDFLLAMGIMAGACHQGYAADPCDPISSTGTSVAAGFVVGGVTHYFTGIAVRKTDSSEMAKTYRLMAMNPMGGSVVCTTPKKNCNNSQCYAYTDVSADFPLVTALRTIGTTKINPVMVDGVEMTQINAADVDVYWSKVYETYTKEGTATLSKNCHGHAFGVGNWPEDGVYGASILLSLDVCYVGASTKEGTLAYSSNHTIKVTGKTCTLLYSMMEITDSSNEKNRESAIYKQANGCDNGVNINKASINQGISFSRYKVKP